MSGWDPVTRMAVMALVAAPLFLWFGNRWFGGWSGFRNDLIEVLKLNFVFMIGADLWDAWAGTIRMALFCVFYGGAVLLAEVLFFPDPSPVHVGEAAR
jgi:hypothetical protein